MTIPQLLLANLGEKLSTRQREYSTKERAYELLKAGTGQDFGYDLKAWREWLKHHPLDRKKMHQSQLPEPNWKRLKKKKAKGE